MARPGSWGALAGCAFLALTLCPGCLGFVHPIGSAKHKEVLPCESVPVPCKNRVHIFIVHGIDPLDIANLAGLCEYLNSLGFIKTHFGLPYHVYLFDREIRKIHEEDPTSRFVLIGFSYGAGLVRDLVYSAATSNIPIDLLVYLDGVPLGQRALDRPANALRVLNILTTFRSPTLKLPEAVNADVEGVWHFGAPTHPQTLKMLAEELVPVALRVPIIETPLPPLPGGPRPHVVPDNRQRLPPPLANPRSPEKLPAPREVPPGQARRDAWDFLRPDGGATGVPGTKPISEAQSAGPP
jgi:hypothetical protein